MEGYCVDAMEGAQGRLMQEIRCVGYCVTASVRSGPQQFVCSCG